MKVIESNLPYTLNTKSANLVINALKDLTDEVHARTLGKAQNAYESLHGHLWQICSKHFFQSKIDIDYADGYSLLNYNCGA